MSSITIIAGPRRAAPAPPVEPARPLLRSLVLTSPGGTVDLMRPPFLLQPGYEGLDEVDTEPDMVAVPGLAGTVLRRSSGNRGVYEQARSIVLPVGVRGAGVESPGDVAEAVQRLKDVLNPQVWGGATESPVRIVGTRYDDSVRWADVTWVPMKGDFGSKALWRPTRSVTVRLVAPDPRALSAAPPVTWRLAEDTEPMLPFLPLVVGSSTVLGFPNPVEVAGDRDASYRARLRGPATRVQLLRGDGTQWTVVPPAPVPAGAEVVIRTDPRTGIADDFDLVQGPGGATWTRYWAPGSVAWGLRPGTEYVTALIEGAEPPTDEDPGTSLTLEFDYGWGSLE